MTLTSGEQRRIQKGIAARVYQLTTEKREADHLYREIYRDLKAWFRVEKYHQIKSEDLPAAISFIDMWQPRKIS
jgi:hypothetical protein